MADGLIAVIGGINCAGDAKDRFHRMAMSSAEMAIAVAVRRTAWKGKVFQGIKTLQAVLPNVNIVLIAIDGGPECQFEQEELTNVIVPMHKNLRLKTFKTVDEFKDFFVNGAKF